MGNRLFRLATGAIFAVMLFGTGRSATADPYKWCAHYGAGMGGGGSNCGFITLDQCRATVSGIGGFCALNNFYTGPDDRLVRRARKRSQN